MSTFSKVAIGLTIITTLGDSCLVGVGDGNVGVFAFSDNTLGALSFGNDAVGVMAFRVLAFGLLAVRVWSFGELSIGVLGFGESSFGVLNLVVLAFRDDTFGVLAFGGVNSFAGLVSTRRDVTRALNSSSESSSGISRDICVMGLAGELLLSTLVWALTLGGRNNIFFRASRACIDFGVFRDEA